MHRLVAVLFEVFLVALILQHHLWVTMDQPVSILHLSNIQLILQLLPLPTPRNGS